MSSPARRMNADMTHWSVLSMSCKRAHRDCINLYLWMRLEKGLIFLLFFYIQHHSCLWAVSGISAQPCSAMYYSCVIASCETDWHRVLHFKSDVIKIL